MIRWLSGLFVMLVCAWSLTGEFQGLHFHSLAFAGTPGEQAATPEAVRPLDAAPSLDEGRACTWTVRTVTEEELWRISDKDPELSPVICREILARLNARAHYYISEDIRNGQPMKVPNDFSAFRTWTPLPKSVAQFAGMPLVILVVKDIPFLGWYENGALAGDTMICIGKSDQPTETGWFPVLEKDADHISRSYNNSYGVPAWMPWAMRLYEAVWIHAGDITGDMCSHGCVTLPLKPAEDLFRRAEPGTPVLIVDSLQDLDAPPVRHARRSGP